jgi:hypothetical protein
MICERDVAVFASVVDTAAFHLDGDDVGGGVIVEAAGLRIEVEAVNGWRIWMGGRGHERKG